MHNFCALKYFRGKCLTIYEENIMSINIVDKIIARLPTQPWQRQGKAIPIGAPALQARCYPIPKWFRACFSGLLDRFYDAGVQSFLGHYRNLSRASLGLSGPHRG